MREKQRVGPGGTTLISSEVSGFSKLTVGHTFKKSNYFLVLALSLPIPKPLVDTAH